MLLSQISSNNPQKDNFNKTFFRLTNSAFFDIEKIVNKDSPDKAKPSARRGRKAAGLLKKDGRAAEG
jgi:hypothetical protein